MSKRLLLHIGTHKTGTSAIQAWMSHLSATGECPVGYAGSGRGGDAHHELAQRFLAFGDISRIEDLRRECQESADQTLVVSSESLIRLTEHQVEDFLSTLCRDSNHFEIEVIVWLRRLDLYLESVFSQRVKSGQDPAVLDRSASLPIGGHGGQIDRLVPWVSALGPERVQVHAYDRKLWPGGSLWKAWWQALGVAAPFDEEKLPRKFRRVNVGPSALTLAVIASLSRKLVQRSISVRQAWRFINEIVTPIQFRVDESAVDAEAIRLVYFTPEERQRVLDDWELRCRQLDELLGRSVPRGEIEGGAQFPESNRSWLIDPDSIPGSYQALYNELLEYAEELAERCQAEDSGVFYRGGVSS